MNNSTIKEIPPLTEEQIAELKALEGRKIDYSDIPKISREEWEKNFKPTRLRRKNLKNVAS